MLLRVKHWFGLSVCILLCTATVVNAKTLEPVNDVEGIREYRLKNGLKVLLFPDLTKETVTVNMTYKVGSKQEKYGETGMAHLLEHLMFKGSKKHKNIPEELSVHGAKPNGTTWIDRTNYYETFAATEENIDWALSLEADRMVNSFVAQKDLDSEMTVVRNEFERSENSPFGVLMDRIFSTAYTWHNNGQATIGALSDIENVSIDSLKAFYKLYYQPDNAVLTVAGKFDEKALLKKIKKAFGKIKKPKRKLPKLYTLEPASDGEKRVTVRRVGDTQLYAAAYHTPAGSHPDYAALEVLSEILGDTPRGRLHKNVTEKKLAVGTYAFPFQLQDPGVLLVAAQVDLAMDVQATRDATVNEIEGIKSNPVTQQELETAKRSLLSDFEQAFKSSEKTAILLSEYVGMGDWRLLFLTRDRIEQVSIKDVQRVAEAYLVRNNRTEGFFLPSEKSERVEIPKAPAVAEQLNGYKGRKAMALGEAFDPSFNNIKQRSAVFTLDNGAKVSLLPKKSRGEEVVVKFWTYFGSEQSLQNMRTAGDAVPSQFLRGTDKYTREQLKTEFDKIKTKISISGGVNSVSGSLTTQREYLIPALGMLAHVLKAPSFNQQEFDLYKTQVLAHLDASRQEPNAIAKRAIGRALSTLSQEHPFYTPTLEESIAGVKALTKEQLVKFYKKYYGLENMVLSIVGDFDQTLALDTVKEHFGSWASKTKSERISVPFEAIVGDTERFETPDKASAIYLAEMLVPINDIHKDAPALDMAMEIFGGGFINSRIANRLRQKDGLSYGAGAYFQLSEEELRSTIGIYAIFAPQNLPKVEQAVKEEINKVLEAGFTQEELDNARKGMLQKAKVNRAQASVIASVLNDAAYLGRDITWQGDYENKIKALTLQDIDTAFKKYVNAEAFYQVSAGNFAKHQ